MPGRMLIAILGAAVPVTGTAHAAGDAPTVVIIVAPPTAPPLLLTPPAPPPEPPVLTEAVRAVIQAAIDSGDPAAVAAVIKFAKQTNPDTASQIEAINQDYLTKLAAKRAREERERREMVAAAGPLELWKGEIEGGASRSTGNSDNLGIYGAVKLARDGLRWRHSIAARLDHQESNDVTTTERSSLAWQSRYKSRDHLYAYGLLQYEHDQFLGYSSRYSAGGGIGYGAIATPKVQLDLEGGPVVRYTDYVAGPSETAIAARASLGLRWTLSPTLKLGQDAAVYLEQGNNNMVATTSLDAKLIGPLKARLSYNVQYEKNAPAERDPLDTLSRATLVYSF